MKEILRDGINGVNDDGDVVAIDHPLWYDEQFEPDHQASDVTQAVLPETTIKTNKVESPGASITLAQRAVAIEAIMSYFNQANKGNGLSKSRGYNNFDEHYGRRADVVVERMSAKESRLYREFTRSVEALLARDSMIEAGFLEQDVDASGEQLTRDLYKEYGPGNAYVGKRNKLVRTVKATARRANGAGR